MRHRGEGGIAENSSGDGAVIDLTVASSSELEPEEESD